MRKKLLLLFVALCFLCQYMLAQQAVTVKSFTKTTDHISVADRRNDLNGNACALLKVQVVDDIDRVEGNNIGDVVNKGVEKWIYMCRGSRNVRIHFKNHLPIRVNFRDYRINSLESNIVYELVLNTPDLPVQQTQVEVLGNDLKMVVSPSNANVTIWGDNYPRKAFRAQDDGTLTVRLPYGRYHYSATASGYNDLEGSVFVNDEDQWESVILEPISGTLIIQCPTKKADFYVNGEMVEKEKDATVKVLQLAPGQYEVMVSKKGHISKTQNATVMASQTTTVDIEELLTKFEQEIADEKAKRKAKKEEKRLQEEMKKAEKEREKAEKERAKAVTDSIAELNKLLEANKKEQERRVKAQEEAQKEEQARVRRQERMARLEQIEKKGVVFGLTAGYNMASASFDSKYDGDVSSIGGFHLGLSTEFRLAKSFWIATGLLYSAKGYEYANERNGIKEKGNPQYIEVPVSASLRFPLGSRLRVQLNVGPYVSFCAGGKVKDVWSEKPLYEETFSSAYSGTDYGLQFGIGADIAYHFHVGLNYQLGMESKYQNRNLMIGVGYRF